jgi:hypothetical protein
LAAAGAGGLTGDTEKGIKTVIAGFGVVADWRALLDLQHFSPHVLGSGLAVLHVRLHIGVQDLDVVEDHGEGDEAGGHSEGAEDHCGECGGAHAAGFLLHLLVFNHLSLDRRTVE